MADDLDPLDDQDDLDDPVPTSAPGTVLAAGALMTLQGAIGIAVAIVYLILAGRGHTEIGLDLYGTALWFLLIFTPVAIAGVFMLLGRKWGQGIGVLLQLLLIPVVWSLFGASDQPLWGMALMVLVLPTLVCLLAPRSTAWFSSRHL